jgi:hypothetical protein
MRMLVMRIRSNSLWSGKWAFWFTMLLYTFAALFVPVSHAQDASNSGCGHSTVADAWGPEFASQAEVFLAQLQRIVKTNDKARFAKLVHYPIEVSVGDKTNKVSTPSDFVRRYRSIVTPALEQTILTQDPKCLFANGQGVMIGHGQLWFRQEGNAMKIVTITLDLPKSRK